MCGKYYIRVLAKVQCEFVLPQKIGQSPHINFFVCIIDRPIYRFGEALAQAPYGLSTICSIGRVII